MMNRLFDRRGSPALLWNRRSGRLALIAGLAFAFSALMGVAQRGPVSAPDLAARMSAKQQGTSLVRVRMQNSGKNSGIFQLLIKSRRSGKTADVVYQVLFPKERKGEAVLLHRAGDRFEATLFTPPNKLQRLGSGDLDQPLFGSAISLEDAIDDPFDWPRQELAGMETRNGTQYVVLESAPGRRPSSYSSVRTWIDPNRLVPLKIEKYGRGGEVTRTIDITKITLDGDDSIPVNLRIRGPRGVTELDGSRFKRGVAFEDTEFTPEGIQRLGDSGQ